MTDNELTLDKLAAKLLTNVAPAAGDIRPELHGAIESGSELWVRLERESQEYKNRVAWVAEWIKREGEDFESAELEIAYKKHFYGE